MHTIDILEEALQLADASGWQIRHEWLGGARGGACRLGAQHLLFVDRSLTAEEQLDQVLQGLRQQLGRPADTDPFTAQFIQCLNARDISNELRRCLALSA
jgi:hypothetical protein